MMPRGRLENFLKKIYYDPENGASYSGVKQLRDAALNEGFNNVSYGTIKNWLSGQEVYSLYKPSRRKFRRADAPLLEPGYQFEMDLADMSRFTKDNEGYRYILLVIDIFSKFVSVAPVKNKDAGTVLNALSNVFENSKLLPQILRSDPGGEFRNKRMKTFLDQKNILHLITGNETKSNFAERAIRTIKMRIMKDMYQRNSRRWFDRLTPIVKGYNNRIHSATGKAPADIDSENESEVLVNLYNEKRRREKTSTKTVKKKRRYSFKVGDIVRVSKLKSLFSRAYDQSFSNELFKIVKRFRKQNIPMYTLKDWADDPIKGSFYQQELTRAKEPDQYKIEKVLSHRTRKGVKESLVKWLGWGDKFNTWVKSSTVKNI